MRRTTIGSILALGTLLAACSGTPVLDPKDTAATDYRPGATYELLRDRFLEHQGWPPGVAPPEIVAQSVAYPQNGPASVAEYRAGPGRWPRIVGVLPAGTRVRLEAVVRHRYPMLEDWYQATGVVLDGEFRGRDVELMRISQGVPGSRMLRVDPAELRLVAPGPGP